MSMAHPLEISVAALEAWLATPEPPLMVDVRESWERELCAIAGSHHIPLGSIPAEAVNLPRDRPVVLICHHGGRSMQATRWLRAQGFDGAINLAGGVEVWATDIDPAMARY